MLLSWPRADSRGLLSPGRLLLPDFGKCGQFPFKVEAAWSCRSFLASLEPVQSSGSFEGVKYPKARGG